MLITSKLKTLKPLRRKECKYPNAPFGVSSITNQPTNKPTNFSFFVSISGLSIYSYLMYTICLAFSFLAILFHIKFILPFVKETKEFVQPGISLIHISWTLLLPSIFHAFYFTSNSSSIV